MPSYDQTQPVAGTSAVPSPPASAPIRGNFDAIRYAALGQNVVADPTFLIWSGGDAAVPDHWTLSGAGAAIARAGTGLADTNRKVGDFCAMVTSGAGAAAVFQQRIVPAASYDDGLDGEVWSAGVWVGTTSASGVKAGLYDGVGTTYSAVHGGGVAVTWTWLPLTRTIDGAATEFTVQVYIPAGTITAYVSGVTVIRGPVQPGQFVPPPCSRRTIVIPVSGTQAIAAAAAGVRFMPDRPCLVLETRLVVGTAPTGQALICDVNRDGTSMYSTKPQVADGATTGAAAPDGTYANRCLGRAHVLTLDVDQVGSGAAGADLVAMIDVLRFDRPFEPFLGVAEVS